MDAGALSAARWSIDQVIAFLHALASEEIPLKSLIKLVFLNCIEYCDTWEAFI
ncbi:MAG: hypothetical protein P8Y36_09930 [Alphaproteobacteria bacterium]